MNNPKKTNFLDILQNFKNYKSHLDPFIFEELEPT